MKGKNNLFSNVGNEISGTKKSNNTSVINSEQENELVFRTLRLQQERLLSIAITSECKRTKESLYRKGASVGDGGTADAIRYEMITGEKVSGKSHIEKGWNSIHRIDNILKKQANHPDKELLTKLKEDLLNALGKNSVK